MVLILLIFWTLSFLSSCLNQYETDSVGFYKVVKYELVDSTKKIDFDFPTLTMNADKTFSLDFKNNTTKGKWKADNYRDFTIADFFYNGHDAQGEILNDNEIEIINPYLFNCPFLKTMIFKKVQKDTNKK